MIPPWAINQRIIIIIISALGAAGCVGAHAREVPSASTPAPPVPALPNLRPVWLWQLNSPQLVGSFLATLRAVTLHSYLICCATCCVLCDWHPPRVCWVLVGGKYLQRALLPLGTQAMRAPHCRLTDCLVGAVGRGSRCVELMDGVVVEELS